MGYAVETGIYSASEAGAPHQRQRLFILAIAQPRRFQPETFGSGNAAELANGNSKHWGKQQQFKGSKGTRTRNEFDRNGKESELANTRHIDGSQRKPERQPKECTEKLCASPELANTGCTRMETPRCNAKQTATRSIEQDGNHVANTDSQRGQLPTEWKQSTIQQPFGNYQKGSNQWPASPGESQKHWEAPRTIESGMGCTVDGYNFREDFLRALGNSVVEQSAAIAFTDLMQKHGLDHLLPSTN
jgi:DNA (cytosine-5)-methyltransferase 1